MTTYRAAYLPAAQDSTSGGFCLTTADQSGLSDEALIAAALPALADFNRDAAAIGESGATDADIVIGEWRD